MSYEYIKGMGQIDQNVVCPPGEIAHSGRCYPAPTEVPVPISAIEGQMPIPFPPRPPQWTKSFSECKSVGGQVIWASGGILPITEQIRAGISSRWCPQSGKTRESVTSAAELERMRSSGVTAIRAMGPEWEKCCYPQSFVDKMEARDAQLRAEYIASPAYQQALAQQEQLAQQSRAAMIRREIQSVAARSPAIAPAGSECVETQGGVTVSYPIPEEVFAGKVGDITSLLPSGCTYTRRFYDSESLELCCSPNVAAQLTAPVKEEQPVEEKKEIPWGWIAAAALGAGALVWLLKR